MDSSDSKVNGLNSSQVNTGHGNPRQDLQSRDQEGDLSEPIILSSTVVKGFGRGSKQLGCPTANLEQNAVSQVDDLSTGVYYGLAILEGTVYPMVSSLGFNPHFGNQHKSLEIHLLHHFQEDFYGKLLGVAILGKLREEAKFDSLDALIKAIEEDKRCARDMLEGKDVKHVVDMLLKLKGNHEQ